MRKEKKYLISAEYKGYDPKLDKAMEKAIGKSDGAGMSLWSGMRDMSWSAPSRKTAMLGVRTLRALARNRHRRIKVSIVSYEV